MANFDRLNRHIDSIQEMVIDLQREYDALLNEFRHLEKVNSEQDLLIGELQQGLQERDRQIHDLMVAAESVC